MQKIERTTTKIFKKQVNKWCSRVVLATFVRKNEENIPKYTAENINHGSKNAAAFFLYHVSAKWRKMKGHKQKKIKKSTKWCNRFFGANLWGKIEKHVRKRMNMLKESSPIAFVWNFVQKNEEKSTNIWESDWSMLCSFIVLPNPLLVNLYVI